MLNVISALGLAVIVMGVAYWWVLAIASIITRRKPQRFSPRYHFAIAIPAHNEETVIGQTVAGLFKLDYPADLLDVYVVSDHCTDETAQAARRAGAVCFERTGEPRSGKGAALSWLLERIWETGVSYDAVVVFDADTQVDPAFLQIMAARLSQGDQVIQGQHRIRNPEAGWFPALTWATFLVDNRFQNQGRANLGLAAKHMGDSICFRSDVLRRIGWGEGLTEDYDLRLRLLLQGIRIAYEPAAIGYGEAPATWSIARRQRERWLAGTYRSSRHHFGRLIRHAVGRRDPALLDAVAQTVLPSYSTLTLLSVAALTLQCVIELIWGPVISPTLLMLWVFVVGMLACYPFLGLVLERAPWRAYLVTLTGPVFIVWRTWLAITSRFGRRAVTWVRTPRAAH